MPDKVFEVALEFRNQRFQDAQKGLQALSQNLNGTMAVVAPVLRKQLEGFLRAVASAMAARHSTPWAPGQRGEIGDSTGKLFRRSGKAMASIMDSVKVDGDSVATMEGHIGGTGYLATHEYGATIRPKVAQYLTIPLPAALNPDGTPIEVKARDWQRTFVIKSKKGNLLIVQKKGKDIVPLYVLKKEVTIPPRLGLRKTLETGIPVFRDKATAAMLDALAQTLSKG